MITGILVLHIFIAALMIGIVLFQRNEGGALGMGGSNSMGGLMTSRGTANLLTRTTAILATTFFVTTILLALLFKGSHKPRSILEETPPVAVEHNVPQAVPAEPSPVVPPVASEDASSSTVTTQPTRDSAISPKAEQGQPATRKSTASTPKNQKSKSVQSKKTVAH